MKIHFYIFASLLMFCACKTSAPRKSTQDYIFFLHNKFLEEFDLDAVSPEYGRAEYVEILNAFRNEGFIVISEKRPSKTPLKPYAQKVVSQIDSLLKTGVKPDHITVIGTSKGGYIAKYVSTFLANPDVNFVFVGAYQESDLKDYPDMNLCGNILTIYERSDFYGVSALKQKQASKLKVKRFREIELSTDLKHGFLYKPMPEWIEPSKSWARRNYRFIQR